MASQRIAIVGGDDRIERVAWPKGFDLRFFNGTRTGGQREWQRLEQACASGSIGCVVWLSRWNAGSANTRAKALGTPFVVWDRGIGQLAKALPELVSAKGIKPQEQKPVSESVAETKTETIAEMSIPPPSEPTEMLFTSRPAPLAVEATVAAAGAVTTPRKQVRPGPNESSNETWTEAEHQVLRASLAEHIGGEDLVRFFHERVESKRSYFSLIKKRTKLLRELRTLLAPVAKKLPVKSPASATKPVPEKLPVPKRNLPEWLPQGEAARQTGLTREALFAGHTEGKITRRKGTGGTWLYRIPDALTYIQEKKKAGDTVFQSAYDAIVAWTVARHDELRSGEARGVGRYVPTAEAQGKRVVAIVTEAFQALGQEAGFNPQDMARKLRNKGLLLSENTRRIYRSVSFGRGKGTASYWIVVPGEPVEMVEAERPSEIPEWSDPEVDAAPEASTDFPADFEEKALIPTPETAPGAAPLLLPVYETILEWIAAHDEDFRLPASRLGRYLKAEDHGVVGEGQIAAIWPEALGALAREAHFDPDRAAAALRDHGLLLTDGERLKKLVRVGGAGSQARRAYCVVVPEVPVAKVDAAYQRLLDWVETNREILTRGDTKFGRLIADHPLVEIEKNAFQRIAREEGLSALQFASGLRDQGFLIPLPRLEKDGSPLLRTAKMGPGQFVGLYRVVLQNEEDETFEVVEPELPATSNVENGLPEEWLPQSDAARRSGLSRAVISSAGAMGKVARKRDPETATWCYLLSDVIAYARQKKVPVPVQPERSEPVAEKTIADLKKGSPEWTAWWEMYDSGEGDMRIVAQELKVSYKMIREARALRGILRAPGAWSKRPKSESRDAVEETVVRTPEVDAFEDVLEEPSKEEFVPEPVEAMNSEVTASLTDMIRAILVLVDGGVLGTENALELIRKKVG